MELFQSHNCELYFIKLPFCIKNYDTCVKVGAYHTHPSEFRPKAIILSSSLIRIHHPYFTDDVFHNIQKEDIPKYPPLVGLHRTDCHLFIATWELIQLPMPDNVPSILIDFPLLNSTTPKSLYN